MDYMFLIYADPDCIAKATPETKKAAMDAHWAIMDDASSWNVFKGCSPLEPPSKAVTIRHSQGTITVVDGPYAETKEYLGGYYLIDCADAEAARYWAERISRAGCGATVEIRALAPIPARTTTQNA